MSRDRINLRTTADLLDLDQQRLFGLGRYLHLTPGDDCIPFDVVNRAQQEDDCEKRYRMVLEWLLAQIQSDRTSSYGQSMKAEQRA
jgi:hypothetical protein